MALPHASIRCAFGALLLSAVALAGCRPPPRDQNIELRLYDVPKGTASALVTTIKDVMWMGDNNLVGRAVVTPDGRLAVLATPAVQSGVENLIDQAARHPAMPEQTTELHYALVVGKPAASAAAYPIGLEEMKAGLDEIVRSQGPQAFTLVQRAALKSLNDEEGRLDNADAHLEIRQKPIQTADGVYAKLGIRWKEDKVETRVQLGPDRIVVLGATGQHAGDAADGSTLYYLVRVAPRADGKNP
jgi:hypothetical protein